MRLLILASAAILPAGSAAAPGPNAVQAAPSQPGNSLTQQTRVISPVPSTCKQIGSVAEGDRRLQGRRLNELPPAQTYMAVYRTDENGCLDPMLASELQRPRRP